MAPRKTALTKPEAENLAAQLPAELARVRNSSRPLPLEELFPGEHNAHIRDSLRTNGVAQVIGGKQSATFNIAASLNADGCVTAVAAKISRTPSRSFDFVKDIKDFTEDTGTPRADKMPIFYRIYRQEGLINNAINKSAALVSSEGTYYVRRAKKGNRKLSTVQDELFVLLDFFVRNVNARGLDSAVTGARGLPAVIDQGSRQAFIEGSWVGYTHTSPVFIPSLNKKYNLPMFIQSMSSRYLSIPDALVGTGLERFYWAPPRETITKILDTRDPDLKKVIEQSFSKDVLAQLKKSGKVLLDPARVIHVKHRGTEIEPFGESFIEPTISDLAYKRSLQALDFVIIEALINRMLIVKVGDENPESDYHNLELAQIRLNLLKTLFDTTDPSITLLWAGHDLEVMDVGSHEALADLDGRYEIANTRVLNAMGVPEVLLNGKNAGGQVWAAYEGYRETLRSMQNSWAQAMVSIGEKIAEENGYEGVELDFRFNRAVLADQSANADLALRKWKAGLSSIRDAVAATGGDFEAERRNKLLERGLNPDDSPEKLPTDEELFSPPLGMPGDTRTDEDGQVVSPGDDPGRKPDSQTEKLSPERPPEKKTATKPVS